MAISAFGFIYNQSTLGNDRNFRETFHPKFKQSIDTPFSLYFIPQKNFFYSSQLPCHPFQADSTPHTVHDKNWSMPWIKTWNYSTALYDTVKKSQNDYFSSFLLYHRVHVPSKQQKGSKDCQQSVSHTRCTHQANLQQQQRHEPQLSRIETRQYKTKKI